MQFWSSDWLHHHGIWAIIPCYHMVTVGIWSRLKTSWKSVVFTNKVVKNSWYSVGVFNKTILYSTCACWIWDDYSQVGATCLDGYLLSHIQSALACLTSISRVCKAAPISLFWAPNRLKELPEVSFQFPFDLILANWKGLFLTGQSWRVLKPWYTSGSTEQG